MLRTLQGLVRLTITLGVIAVVLGMIAQEFFVDVLVITHNGMAPTVVAGDEIAVWRGANVDMADVVVCEHPSHEGELVMGRAVVFAGHTIQSDHNGSIYVDGDRTLTEPLAPVAFYDTTRKKLFDMGHGVINYGLNHDHEYFIERGTTLDLPSHTVAQGVFLLGDNRSAPQYDSRAFGDVRPETCIGQAFARIKSAPSNDDDLDRAPIGWIE